MPAAAATDETRQGLLDALRSREAGVRAAEIAKIQVALEWAVAHEVMIAWMRRRSMPGSASTG